MNVYRAWNFGVRVWMFEHAYIFSSCLSFYCLLVSCLFLLETCFYLKLVSCYQQIRFVSSCLQTTRSCFAVTAALLLACGSQRNACESDGFFVCLFLKKKKKIRTEWLKKCFRSHILVGNRRFWHVYFQHISVLHQPLWFFLLILFSPALESFIYTMKNKKIKSSHFLFISCCFLFLFILRNSANTSTLIKM